MKKNFLMLLLSTLFFLCISIKILYAALEFKINLLQFNSGIYKTFIIPEKFSAQEKISQQKIKMIDIHLIKNILSAS